MANNIELDFRPSTHRVISNLSRNQGLIGEILSTHLIEKGWGEPEKWKSLFDYYRAYSFWEKVLLSAESSGINLSHALSELLKLNSPDLWGSLLEATHSQDSDSVNRMNRAFGTRSMTDTANSVYRNNIDFYGSAIFLSTLSIMLGSKLESHLRPEAIKFTSLNAATNISRRYDAPVSSPLDFIERLKDIYPAKPATDPGSLLSELVASKAFKKTRDLCDDYCPEVDQIGELPSHVPIIGTIHCPAIGLTDVIFDKYSEILGTDEYQSFLLNKISLPNTVL